MTKLPKMSNKGEISEMLKNPFGIYDWPHSTSTIFNPFLILYVGVFYESNSR